MLPTIVAMAYILEKNRWSLEDLSSRTHLPRTIGFQNRELAVLLIYPGEEHYLGRLVVLRHLFKPVGILRSRSLALPPLTCTRMISNTIDLINDGENNRFQRLPLLFDRVRRTVRPLERSHPCSAPLMSSHK